MTMKTTLLPASRPALGRTARILISLLASAAVLGWAGCERTAPAGPESAGEKDTGGETVSVPLPDAPPETEAPAEELVYVPPEGPEEEEEVLRVWVSSPGSRMFELAYPDTEVDLVVSDEQLSAEGFDPRADLEERLRSAEGAQLPDVMILRTGDPWNGSEGILNLTQLAREGLFYDLDRLFAEHNVSLVSCVPEVMEAGILDRERIFLPLFYSVGMVYTTEERLERAGIPWEEGMDLETFSAPFPAFWKTHANANTFRNFWYPDVMCGQNGVDLLTDSPESRAAAERICRVFNNLFPDIATVGASRFYAASRPWYPGSLEESWRAGDLVFLSGFSAGGSQDFLSSLADRYYAEDVKAGEHPLLFPMPTLDGGAPYPVPMWSVAVSSRAEHPKAAAKFIRYLLSTEAQNHLSSGGAPVNRMSLTWWRSLFLNYKKANGAAVDMDEDFVNGYFDSLENLRSPVWWDAEGNSMLTWCAMDMALGKPFEEAYPPVREKLDAYFGGK